MANKKRTRNPYYKSLGTFHLKRKDVLVLEKIIKKHMRVHDEKLGRFYGASTKKLHDFYIQAGKPRHGGIRIGKLQFGGFPVPVYPHTEDSVKFLPTDIKKTRHLILHGHPGIRIVFSPFKTEVYAQRHYATGLELESMDAAIEAIRKYLDERIDTAKSRWANRISLS